MNVTLTLNPEQTMQVFQGKTVQTIAANARAVGQAVLSAAKGNAGRLALGTTMLAPGEVTR